MKRNEQHADENIDMLEDAARQGKLRTQHVFISLPSVSLTTG